MNFTKKDFKIDWFSGSGAGGQHRNKHQNCVRITHIDTGITTLGQSHRERKRNFEDAFNEMGNRLVAHFYPTQQKERSPSTKLVRTYNYADNMVVDHMLNEKFAIKDMDNVDLLWDILKRKLSMDIGDDD